MSDIHLQIELMLDQGESPAYIAKVMHVPLSWVYEVLETMEEPEDYSPFATLNS